MTKAPVSAVIVLALVAAFAVVIFLSRTIAPTNLYSALGARLDKIELDVPTRVAFLTAGREAEPYVESVELTGQPPVEVQLLLKPTSPASRARVLEAMRKALRVFALWYGAFPYRDIVVLDLPWNSELVGATYPQLIGIGTRWVTPVRDVTVERTIVGALARQYLFAVASPDASDRWFDESLALYTGTRAVHETLENGNPEIARFFGAHLPVVIRPVELSPNRADPRPRVRHFAEIDGPPRAAWRAAPADSESQSLQGALALHALERYLGWPAMQQALAGYRERALTSGGSPKTFAAIVSEQRGRDLSWFFDQAFRAGVRFDYAIDRLTSEPADAARDMPGQFRTTVGLRRIGDGVFAGTSQPLVGDFGHGRALKVSVTFDDGAEIEEYWGGRESDTVLEFSSSSRAVSASLDPQAMLVLDRDRGNNTRSLRSSFSPIGLRLALHWMVWLQDLMLSYAA